MKFSLGKLILEIVAALVLLVMVGAGALAWRLSEGPLQLDFLKNYVEDALTNARGGRPVTVDGVALEWSPDRRRVEATLTGIAAFDESGRVQVQAERGDVSFDSVSLFRGELRVAAIRMEDGFTSFHRNEDGVWSIGTAKPSGVVENGNQNNDLEIGNWRAFLPVLREAIATSSFERVEFEDFEIGIFDRVAGLEWQGHDAFGEWSADASGVGINMSADMEGDQAPESMQVRFFSDSQVEQFSFEVGGVGVDPERMGSLIASRNLPFSYQGRADIVFGGEASEADGLRRLQLSAACELCEVTFKNETHAIEAIGFEVHYDVSEHVAEVTGLTLETERIAGYFSGRADLSVFFEEKAGPSAISTDDGTADIETLLVSSRAIPITFSARDAVLDITPVFERAWNIEAADMSGVLHPDLRALVVNRLIARNSALNGTADGLVWFLERPVMVDDGVDVDEAASQTRLKVAARLNAQAEGIVKKRDILDYWPVNLGAMSRSWVDDHVLAGTATSLDFSMDLHPDIYERGYLDNDSLTLEFTVEDADVSFLEDVPPVKGAKGVGTLRGNSLFIEVETGDLGGWTMDGADIDLPQFHPQGATAEIETTGRGDLQSLMWILENSELKTASEAGLVIDEMSGFGGLDALITWPMQEEILVEDVGFKVSGGFLDSNIPDLAGGFGLIDSDVDVELDNQGMILRGQGRFGPAPVEFNWIETFPPPGEENGHSRLEATAVVTPDFLNAFNIAARNVLAGDIEVQLSADGQGRDFEAIDARMDLTRAAIDLSEFGWIKRVNEPASGVVRYARDIDGLTMTSGDIQAEGLALSGEVLFRPEIGLERATIDRMWSENRMDLGGSVLRDAQGDYTIDVSGPLLNATSWIDGLMNFGANAGASAQPVLADGPNASVTIAVDDLILREDASLTNAQLALEARGGVVIKGLVAGTIGEGRGLEASMEYDEYQRIVNLRSDDAGWVVRVLTNLGYLEAGRLEMTGRFGEDVGSAEVRMSNVRLKNAPLFAQVFSLASLQGLSDVLSGDGVLFTEVDAPLRFRKGRVDFEGARASGPAMGLTLRGWLGMETGELGLDGVVVPSFGVNSALGGIPIIGDLFVSRQGEGVFAVVYSVRGNLERARVAINPLSAVAPGFLRRIMENPSRPPPDDLPPAEQSSGQ